MLYGFNFGLLDRENFGLALPVCLLEGRSGDWYGFSSGPIAFGTSNPTHTKGNILIYSIQWNVNGQIQISFGDTGDEKLVGIDTIDVTGLFFGIRKSFFWSIVQKKYVTTDSSITDQFILHYVEGQERCFLLNLVETTTWITEDEVLWTDDSGFRWLTE